MVAIPRPAQVSVVGWRRAVRQAGAEGGGLAVMLQGGPDLVWLVQ